MAPHLYPAVTDVQVRRLRITSQLLTDDSRAGPSPVDVARALCGVQAQVPAAASLAIRARSAGLTAVGVDRALFEERSLARTWLMRGTLHLVAAEDLRWLLALLGPVFDAADRQRRLQLGLTDAICEAGVSVIRTVLGSSGALTRGEILKHLRARGVDIAPTGQALIHLIGHAARLGVVCLGPPRLGQDSYVLLDDWLPQQRNRARDAALSELARRYLAAYGPASEADLAAWSGLPLGDARSAVNSIAKEISAVRHGPDTLWLLRGKLPKRPSGPPAVRLLPNFDTYLLGYRNRELMVASDAARRIQRGGGWIHPALMIDGWISGTWRVQRMKGRVNVVVEPFEPLNQTALARLEQEVTDVGRFLG